jgi:hypothetical protein
MVVAAPKAGFHDTEPPEHDIAVPVNDVPSARGTSNRNPVTHSSSSGRFLPTKRIQASIYKRTVAFRSFLHKIIYRSIIDPEKGLCPDETHLRYKAKCCKERSTC